MRLIMQCAICGQSMVVQAKVYQHFSCPRCKALMQVRQPRLAEHEIMKILGQQSNQESLV